MSELRQLGILNKEGMKAFNRGNFASALFQLAQAERLAHYLNSALHQAKVRNNMALIHQANGDMSEALSCYRLAARSAMVGAGDGSKLQRTIERNMERLESEVLERAA